MHERHAADPTTPRLAGWWGNDPASRFLMAETFEPARGADGFRVSTPPILSLAPIAVSLADVRRGRHGRLARALARPDGRSRAPHRHVRAGRDRHHAPRAGRARRAAVDPVPDAHARLRALEAFDVVGDVREPDLIRLAPVPLYCSFEDVVRAADALARTA